jgi:hypothetical protein
MDPSSWSGAQCQNQRNVSLEAIMNLKLSIAALFLVTAIPAAAQTIDTTLGGCEGAVPGTVLADGTICTDLGTSTLGTHITPLMGGEDDSDGENEGTQHQNSATHTENNSTDHDSVDGNDDNDDNGSDHDNSNDNDDNGSDHDNDSDNGDDD